MLYNIAHQKLSTEKPDNSLLANITINASITNRKSPKVRMVTGMVNKTKIGFTKVFNKARTNVKPTELQNPFKWTPGNIQAVT